MDLCNEDIFDNLIYSLPVLGHSTSITTRSPTIGNAQQSKYMPDFGGILEIPGSNLKNNSLLSGIPFKTKPKIIVLEGTRAPRNDGPLVQSRRSDSMAASRYLETRDSNQFSIIRATGRNLDLDLVTRSYDDNQRPIHSITNYGHIPYSIDISSIKHSEFLPETLIVNFNQGVKTLRLNRSYVPPQDETDQPPDDLALQFISSISERPGCQVKDACLNPYNQNIEAIASDNFEYNQIKFHDLNQNPRQPFQTIKWASDDKLPEHIDLEFNPDLLPAKPTRSFKPSRPARYGIQGLDCIPSHLVNVMVTTAHRTLQIDPRLAIPAQVLLDKSKLDSFYPTELIRRTLFSSRNQYQFYSVSNIHLRIFDTRYPGMPMNQLNHMLDSDIYDNLESKLISFDDNNLEILCSSANGTLSFCSFDQSQTTQLVNPKSIHMPIQDPNPTLKWLSGTEHLSGLTVICDNDKDDCLFTVINLIGDDICLRQFEPPNKWDDQKVDSQETLLNSQLTHWITSIGNKSSLQDYDSDLDIGECSRVEPKVVKEDEYINILDTDSMIDFEDRFSSKRAIERFEKMKTKLLGS